MSYNNSVGAFYSSYSTYSSPPLSTRQQYTGKIGVSGYRNISGLNPAANKTVKQRQQLSTSIDKALGSNKFTKCLNFIFHHKRTVTLGKMQEALNREQSLSVNEATLKSLPKNIRGNFLNYLAQEGMDFLNRKDTASFKAWAANPNNSAALVYLKNSLYNAGKTNPNLRQLSNYKVVQLAGLKENSAEYGLTLLNCGDKSGFQTWAINPNNSIALQNLQSNVYIGNQTPRQGQVLVTQAVYEKIQLGGLKWDDPKYGLVLLNNNNMASFETWAKSNRRAFETLCKEGSFNDKIVTNVKKFFDQVDQYIKSIKEMEGDNFEELSTTQGWDVLLAASEELRVQNDSVYQKFSRFLSRKALFIKMNEGF